MQFKDKDIQHIADLARLDLTPAELKVYGEQLSSITSYIDQLQEVEIDVNSSAQASNNVWREDKAIDWPDDEVRAALEQGDYEGGLLKVKRVL
jgi:aspartyl-tRNA(Asn)/glutamyl-tRNA(Gln) amidotransferase subunit C